MEGEGLRPFPSTLVQGVTFCANAPFSAKPVEETLPETRSTEGLFVQTHFLPEKPSSLACDSL